MIKKQENKERKELYVLDYVKSKDPALKQKILLAYKPLIEYIAKKLAYREEDFDDLAQVGSIGLLKALDNFDPSKNTSFTTYSSSHIIGEIKHYLRDKIKILKIPRRLQEQHYKIQKFIKVSLLQNGKTPTVKEISKATGIDNESVIETLEASRHSQLISLDMPVFSNNQKTDTLLDQNCLDFEGDQIFVSEMLKHALTKLPLRLQKIIYLKYYEGLTQREIANRIQLSQVHISRLLRESLQKLKNILNT